MLGLGLLRTGLAQIKIKRVILNLDVKEHARSTQLRDLDEVQIFSAAISLKTWRFAA